jgi:hypothetical protein
MAQTTILDRAFRAFLAASGGANAGHRRDLTPVAVVLGGLHYIVLQDGHAVLAVYRVRNNGALRRMRKWPLARGRANASASTQHEQSTATDHTYSI